MNETYLTVHSKVYEWMFNNLSNLGLSEQTTHVFNAVILMVLLVAVLYVIDYIFRRILLITVSKLVSKSKTVFDDYLFKHKVFKYFVHIISITVIRFFIPIIFIGFPRSEERRVGKECSFSCELLSAKIISRRRG